MATRRGAEHRDRPAARETAGGAWLQRATQVSWSLGNDGAALPGSAGGRQARPDPPPPGKAGAAPTGRLGRGCIGRRGTLAPSVLRRPPCAPRGRDSGERGPFAQPSVPCSPSAFRFRLHCRVAAGARAGKSPRPLPHRESGWTSGWRARPQEGWSGVRLPALRAPTCAIPGTRAAPRSADPWGSPRLHVLGGQGPFQLAPGSPARTAPVRSQCSISMSRVGEE